MPPLYQVSCSHQLATCTSNNARARRTPLPTLPQPLSAVLRIYAHVVHTELSGVASPCLHRENLLRMLFPVILTLALPRACRAQSPRQRVRRQAKRRRGRRRQAGQSLLLLCLVGPRTTASERWPSTLRTQALRQRPAQRAAVRVSSCHLRSSVV